MRRYWLPSHVYVRILKDIVWFDERSNRYITIDGAASSILAQAVHGWPQSEKAQSESHSSNGRGDALISQLVARGLLSETLGKEKRYLSSSDEPPRVDGVFDGRLRKPSIRWHHVIRVTVAFIWAVVAFRIFGLAFAIASVERRKRACSDGGPDNLHAVGELVNAFRFLRLFFYSPKDRCLFDSLVLTFYLLPYRVAVEMVFGVTVRPFRAHCWDEWNGFVLNGGSEIARRHSRIRQV